ncbi:MAG TPA: hypothetical protein VGL70_11850 [Candidatus Binatia bacterium]
MASKIDWQRERYNSFEDRLQPQIVSKRGGQRFGVQTGSKQYAFT